MEIVTKRTALLLALLDGPGYGAGLIERARSRAAGLVLLGPGTVYPTLRALVAQGLLKSWTVVPRGHRGARSRVYYELTPRGVTAAEGQRQALRALVARRPAPRPSAADVARMRDRIHRSAELGAFVLDLRARTRAATNARR